MCVCILLIFTDYDARDFPTEAKDAEECFEYLNCLIKQYENIDTAGKRKFLVQVILLCATHSSIYFWSSKESLSSSQGMFYLLTNICNCLFQYFYVCIFMDLEYFATFGGNKCKIRTNVASFSQKLFHTPITLKLLEASAPCSLMLDNLCKPTLSITK